MTLGRVLSKPKKTSTPIRPIYWFDHYL
uniref:Uncharacterized protein n=1 Tax=Lepeophtheirus salmonis TaxID=72036 RepID=A0A0K2TTU2_LEPSM